MLSVHLIYELEDRPFKTISLLAALQRLIFIISGNFVVPLIEGVAGMWWGVIILGSIADALGKDPITGTYLLLLSLQLSGPFLKGMLGIDSNGGMVDWKIASLSLAVVILVLLLSLRGRSWLKSLTPLIGIVVFILLDLDTEQPRQVLAPETVFFSLPQSFNWGRTDWDLGIVFTSISCLCCYLCFL